MKFNKVSPKNLTAQAAYRAAGNPPSTTPESAIANCFPGLEYDFRNLWPRIFVGIRLYEARPVVVAIEDDSLQHLDGQILFIVAGTQIWAQVTGPETAGGPNRELGFNPLEYANVLADVVQNPGAEVACQFFDPNTGQLNDQTLTVRDIFHRGEDGERHAAFAEDLVGPGELTQSLCSPWQNDYLECACYYWAASRPDFVNSEVEDGSTGGHNWIHKDRTETTPKQYSLRRSDLLGYEDLFQNWEQLRFIENGHDKE